MKWKKTVLQENFDLAKNFDLMINFDFFDLITWNSLIFLDRPTIRPGLNVCPGVPSRLAKYPGISLQWNFQNELQADDAIVMK